MISDNYIMGINILWNTL